MKFDGDDGIVVLVSAKRTPRGNPLIRKGSLKGKRVELAPTTKIGRVDDIAESFMRDIFGFEPGHYLITVLSSLHNFVGVDDVEIRDMFARIRTVYRLDLADLPDGNLLEIFKRLQEHQMRGRKYARAH